ncbi:hypothetical protein BN1088_1433136 [Sphingobacterium sp. PM2-P1-29]|nr:hypothetical protein BN1088_1433136 [Sphingobacterium sp. PM2-P1-29]
MSSFEVRIDMRLNFATYSTNLMERLEKYLLQNVLFSYSLGT